MINFVLIDVFLFDKLLLYYKLYKNYKSIVFFFMVVIVVEVI